MRKVETKPVQIFRQKTSKCLQSKRKVLPSIFPFGLRFDACYLGVCKSSITVNHLKNSRPFKQMWLTRGRIPPNVTQWFKGNPCLERDPLGRFTWITRAQVNQELREMTPGVGCIQRGYIQAKYVGREKRWIYEANKEIVHPNIIVLSLFTLKPEWKI